MFKIAHSFNKLNPKLSKGIIVYTSKIVDPDDLKDLTDSGGVQGPLIAGEFRVFRNCVSEALDLAETYIKMLEQRVDPASQELFQSIQNQLENHTLKTQSPHITRLSPLTLNLFEDKDWYIVATGKSPIEDENTPRVLCKMRKHGVDNIDQENYAILFKKLMELKESLTPKIHPGLLNLKNESEELSSHPTQKFL